LILKFDNQRVFISKVDAHTGAAGNERAHALAKQAVKNVFLH